MGAYQCAPKMVVEILSSPTALKDTTIKFSTYEKKGVELYMMVDYELNIKIGEESNNGEFKFDFDGCATVFDIDK